MTVPWVGFPLSDLVRLAEPTSSAKYVVFTTLADPKTCQPQAELVPPIHRGRHHGGGDEAGSPSSPWACAAAPSAPERRPDPPHPAVEIRVQVHKSIVKVEFTDKRPVSFWEALQDSEYGFWANVNPAVPHPRWSQAKERLLGTDEMVATQIWNGYGEFVAGLYADKRDERLFA